MYGKVTEGTLDATYIVDKQRVPIDSVENTDSKKHTMQLLNRGICTSECDS